MAFADPECRQSKGSESEADKGPPQDKKGPNWTEKAEPGGGSRPRGGGSTPRLPPHRSDPPEQGDPPTPRGLGPPDPPPAEQHPEEGVGTRTRGGPPRPHCSPPPPEEPEPEPEPWGALVPPPVLQGLSKSERRRQEGINELVLTERAHVRVLRVLLELFYAPTLRGGFFPPPELHNIFPSLEDLVEAHALFLGSLRRRQKESGFVVGAIGDLLLARFEGAEGRWFQKISARFCSRQPFALEQLKAKQRKDARFNHLIQEAESHPRCRRLQLRDIIPSEMQRLTKYPLLLQSIAACTEEPQDRAHVEQAAECCRRILDHVNREVRDMENFMKLKDYQRRLDLSGLKQSSDPLLSEFKSTDLTKRNLVHEGPLTWRLSRDKAVEVQVLLLDDLLVLLQRLFAQFPPFSLFAQFPHFGAVFALFHPISALFPPRGAVFAQFPHFRAVFALFHPISALFPPRGAVFAQFPHFGAVFALFPPRGAVFAQFPHFGAVFALFPPRGAVFAQFPHFGAVFALFPPRGAVFAQFPHFRAVFALFHPISALFPPRGAVFAQFPHFGAVFALFPPRGAVFAQFPHFGAVFALFPPRGA
ncbi:uncharacterized protein PRD47_001093, partial [Ara ararauna]